MITLAAALLGASVPLLQGTPPWAQTQLSRTWVSGAVGSDANPCSRSQPCATFFGAYGKTTAGGSINCVDPGDFGGLNINKSIQIDCSNTNATQGVNGFAINSAGIIVVLRGLSIDGAGIGITGVWVTAAATVIIEKSTIRGFRNTNGSAVRITHFSSIAEVYISDTNIIDNGTEAAGGGVFSVPTGNAFAVVELRNVNIKKNTFGVANTTNSRMRISHASIAGNGIGLVNDPGSIVTLNDVDIIYNNTGISGATTSYGNNRIAGNNSDGTPPTPAGAQSHDAGQR
jgi:hypothetical protein